MAKGEWFTWRHSMKSEKLKLSGKGSLIAGVAFLAAGILGKNTTFFVLGCAFIAIGSSFIAKTRI